MTAFRAGVLRFAAAQSWLFRGQDRLLRFIWHPDRGQSYPFEIDFFGMTYPGDLARYIDWSVFCYGSYAYRELSLLQTLAQEVRRSRGVVTFVDVGANVGHHTLFMSPHADHVLAFEPNPELIPLIEEKVRRNNLKNITLVPTGLGELDADLRYYPGRLANSGIGTFVANGNPDHGTPIVLPIRRGDSVFATTAPSSVDILKIDVEGFEVAVLRGLRETIMNDRPAILIEMSDRTRDAAGTEAQFRHLLYPGHFIAEVTGRHRKRFNLLPFDYAKSEEAVIFPPDLAKTVCPHLVAPR